LAKVVKTRQAMDMNSLDLKGPSTQPKILEESQQVSDSLWRALREALERIEQLEEQLRTDSGNSSKAPSSDSPRSRAQGAQPGHERISWL
jgi:hypothetical protein